MKSASKHDTPTTFIKTVVLMYCQFHISPTSWLFVLPLSVTATSLEVWGMTAGLLTPCNTRWRVSVTMISGFSIILVIYQHKVTLFYTLFHLHIKTRNFIRSSSQISHTGFIGRSSYQQEVSLITVQVPCSCKVKLFNFSKYEVFVKQ